jgi:Family of unknown function (DUF6492)
MASERLDAVLPLTMRDAERAQILLRSLERLFEPLRTCFVVAPDGDVASLRRQLGRDWCTVLAESELVPELGWFRAIARLRSKLHVAGPPFHGWFVQQLVKLAVAERVETPFYLTLDADVICVRPTAYDDLVRGGRALVQLSPPNHPEWNDDAERVLALPRSGHQYGVTPALISREAVAALAHHLERRVDPRLRQLGRRAPSPKSRRVLASWRSFLLRNLPWTEYALYHTFLEQTGRFDDLHVFADGEELSGNNVWIESQFEEWRPSAEGPYCFSVVQSATRIAPGVVAERLEPEPVEAGPRARQRAAEAP